VSNDLIAVKLDQARMLLAEARDAGDAKKVADLARAAEVYARRQKLSEEAIDYAHAVKIDALTLMGELLEQAPKNRGTAGNGSPHRIGGLENNPPKTKPPTLAEQGIKDKHAAKKGRSQQ
jgi:hypothetical protein